MVTTDRYVWLAEPQIPLLTASRSLGLRARALERIATLSTEPEVDNADHRVNFDRLYDSLPSKRDSRAVNIDHDATSLARTSMTIEELQILLALCKAAPNVEGARDAEKLLLQLQPYLFEAYEQSIAPSAFFHLVEGSPWEALSKNLTTAVLSIAIRHPALHRKAWEVVISYVRNCGEKASKCIGKQNAIDGEAATGKGERARDLLILFMSILGFLDAAAFIFH
jgi:phosphatidylinositol 4-kinase